MRKSANTTTYLKLTANKTKAIILIDRKGAKSMAHGVEHRQLRNVKVYRDVNTRNKSNQRYVSGGRKQIGISDRARVVWESSRKGTFYGCASQEL